MPASEQIAAPAAVAGITIFALLKAFSQGATALTGVEAISNGVPAFKRPQAQNAATTLAIMGTIAVTMFLGISYLATHVHGVVASEERSAVAQIAVAVFGNGSLGFYVRAGVHRGDPDPRREHRVPGLPAARLDPRHATGSCRASS